MSKDPKNKEITDIYKFFDDLIKDNSIEEHISALNDEELLEIMDKISGFIKDLGDKSLPVEFNIPIENINTVKDKFTETIIEEKKLKKQIKQSDIDVKLSLHQLYNLSNKKDKYLN